DRGRRRRRVLAGRREDGAGRGDGERVGEVVEDAHTVPVPEGVYPPGDHLPEPGSHALDPSGVVGRPEVPHRLAAHPVVLGRVVADEPPQFPLASRALVVVLREAARIRADPWVVQQGGDLPVGADDVSAVLLARQGRVWEFGIERVGVGAVRVVQHLLVDAGGCSHNNDSLPGCTSTARRSSGVWPVSTTVAWWAGIRSGIS